VDYKRYLRDVEVHNAWVATHNKDDTVKEIEPVAQPGTTRTRTVSTRSKKRRAAEVEEEEEGEVKPKKATRPKKRKGEFGVAVPPSIPVEAEA